MAGSWGSSLRVFSTGFWLEPPRAPRRRQSWRKEPGKRGRDLPPEPLLVDGQSLEEPFLQRLLCAVLPADLVWPARFLRKRRHPDDEFSNGLDSFAREPELGLHMGSGSVPAVLLAIADEDRVGVFHFRQKPVDLFLLLFRPRRGQDRRSEKEQNDGGCGPFHLQLF